MAEHLGPSGERAVYFHEICLNKFAAAEQYGVAAEHASTNGV
jgi:hypothetical protein